MMRFLLIAVLSAFWTGSAFAQMVFDGVTDDRPALLAAMAASKNVQVPSGDCLMDNSGGYIEIDNWGGVLTFLGGASIVLMDNSKGGLLFNGGTGLVVNNLTLTYRTLPTIRTGQHAVLFGGTINTVVNGARVTGGGQGAIKGDEAVRLKLTNVHVEGSMSDGIGFYNCQDCEVANATVINSGDDALSFVNYTINANYTGGLATNISVTNSQAGGIKVAGQSGVVISQFRINGTVSSAVHVMTDAGTRSPSNVKIAHGIIENAGRFGAEVSGTPSADLEDVLVLSAAGIGIGGSGNGRVRVSNSRVTGNISAAYELDGTTDVVLENVISQDSPIYAFVVQGAKRLIANNLTAINAFSSGAQPHRAFYFTGNTSILANGLHIIDDQSPAGGYQIYENANGGGTLANITHQISHGSFSFFNGSGNKVVGFVNH